MRLHTLLLAATIVSAPLSAVASPISALFVFGDSLSDNGNLTTIVSTATGGTVTVPAPPYAPGRASNGQVAVEFLAQHLGLAPLLPVAFGGTNYSVIGAATDEIPFPVPGDLFNTADNVAEALGQPLPIPTGILNAQLPLYIASLALTGPIDPRALFVIWGGPNDLALNPTLAGAQTAADNITLALDTLYGYGARRFLIPGMPDLGLTPGASDPEGLTALTDVFNARLFGNLKSRREFEGIGIASFDTASFFQQAVAGDLGFTNVAMPCVAGNVIFAVRMCSPDDEGEYLFWDSSHPTTTAHKMLGGEFAAAVAPLTVPEPLTLTLAGLGVAAVVFRRRRAA